MGNAKRLDSSIADWIRPVWGFRPYRNDDRVHYAEATRLAPLEYIGLLWTLLADLLTFKLPLSTSFLLAGPLVLLGPPSRQPKRANPRSGMKTARFS